MNILKELEQGNVSAVLHKLASLVETGVTDVENQFPIIGQFISQFATDFGKKVLADAEALAPAVISGQTSIVAAAEQLVVQAAPQAASIAAADASNVALNALRLYVSAPATAPSTAS